MTRWFLVIGFLILNSLALGGLKKEDVQKITLKNGMTIYVLEDHSIPNANMYLFWKVGSRNEHPGITGLSHFFEHMMFNGSKKYGPKEFDRVMEANGGANNAYTSNDMTAYTNWFPSESIEVIFDLEADRIENLAIDQKMLDSERGVVISERSTGLENSPLFLLYNQVYGAAFYAHPYRWPVLGYLSDIKNWKLEDLVDYHKTYYAPNNAVVVISGDVTYDQVKKLSKKYFAPIPTQKSPRKVHTKEPKQNGERTVYVQKESVTSPYVLMSYHTPNGLHKDHKKLELLSSILSDGKSSRLHRALVEEQQIATQTGIDFHTGFDPALFTVYGAARKGVSSEKLKQALIQEINKIIKNGVQQKELDKVRNKAKVDFYKTLQTINGKANTLGTYELLYGGYEKMFGAMDEMKKIQIKDIQDVAKKYLIKANRTTGILDSKPDTKEGDL